MFTITCDGNVVTDITFAGEPRPGNDRSRSVRPITSSAPLSWRAPERRSLRSSWPSHRLNLNCGTTFAMRVGPHGWALAKRESKRVAGS
jgi:hypothetical protein